MKKNKFSIHVENADLSEKDLKKLLDAVQATVNAQLKKSKKKAVPTPKKKALTIAPAATATVSAVFTNTNPGLSELKAKHKTVTKTLTQTGNVSFDNVNTGDIIAIQGKSLGSSEISIDVEASPQEKKFPPGTFNFNFFIL